MRAEHLAPGPAAGAAIACAFLALGLMLLRQMARQEQVLREILRMHQELLDSTRLLILTQQETLEKQRLYDLEHPHLVCASGLFLNVCWHTQCVASRMHLCARMSACVNPCAHA